MEDPYASMGFTSSKMGSGEKELGYAIKRASLWRLTSFMLVLITGSVAGFLYVQFEIRLERKVAVRETRQQHHHAAVKLAKVEMELWSHFHEDIKESADAQNLLQSLNASYEKLGSDLHAAITNATQDIGLILGAEKVKALADKLTHLTVEHRQKSIKEVKGLVDHLVSVGKKSQTHEKTLKHEMKTSMEEEVKEMAEAGVDMQASETTEEQEHREEDDKELRGIIDVFWGFYDDFKKEFSVAIETLTVDSPQFKQMGAIQKRIDTAAEQENYIETSELETLLKTVNLKQMGLVYRANSENPAMRSPHDFLETMLLIPTFPRKELTDLEHDYRSGTKNAFSTLNELRDLQDHKKLPMAWLDDGVERFEENQDEAFDAEGEATDGEDADDAAVQAEMARMESGHGHGAEEEMEDEGEDESLFAEEHVGEHHADLDESHDLGLEDEDMLEDVPASAGKGRKKKIVAAPANGKKKKKKKGN